MSPRRSPAKIGPFHTFYDSRPYRGGDIAAPREREDEYETQTFTKASLRKSEGEDCAQKIADLHASSQVIVEIYTQKLDAKCDRLLAAEMTQKKADMLIRKNQHIEQYKEQLNEHIKDQQTLCELDVKLEHAKKSLDNVINLKRGVSSVDNQQIIKLQSDVQNLEHAASLLKNTIETNQAKITAQEPNFDCNPSAGACCIM
jgi:hypothetical protein